MFIIRLGLITLRLDFSRKRSSNYYHWLIVITEEADMHRIPYVSMGDLFFCVRTIS